MTNPAFYSNVTDKAASRDFMQYIQQIIDQPLGQMVVTSDGKAPAMKKHGTIVWRDTSIGIAYIVHYDGTHKYFWEAAGEV